MATKRFFRIQGAIIFIAVLSMVLAGCGGGNSITAGVGVDTSAKTITLGILTPLTGAAAAPIGIPLTNGIKVFFDNINATGGIDGYTVNLDIKDNKYPDTATQVQQYEAMRNQVLMIAESLGTPTTFAIKDLAAADNMLVSAATLASSLAYVPNMVMVGTPYRLQVDNAFDYLVNHAGPNGTGVQNPKTAILYQNDDYGLDGLSGYLEAVKAYNLTDEGQVPFTFGQQNVAPQIVQLQQSGAQYVFLTSTPGDTATILLTAHALGYDPQWILQSPAYANVLQGVPGLAPLLAAHAWLVGQGATWGDTTQPGMAQMMKDIAKYSSKYTPDHSVQTADGYFEFGYTEAKITYAILKKAADNGDLTRAGLVTAFESLKNVDLGGLYPPANYGTSPNDRVPTRDSVIFKFDPTAAATGYVTALMPDFVGMAAANANF